MTPACLASPFVGPSGRYGARFYHDATCEGAACVGRRTAACGGCGNYLLGVDGECRACGSPPFGWSRDFDEPEPLIEIRRGTGSVYLSPSLSPADAGRLLAALG